ncbi:hypothetical protein GCM10027190_24280 [Spirosoma areae]
MVLSPDNPADPDVIVAFISSVVPVAPGRAEFVLDTSHPDFIASGISKSWVFRMDKLATLDKAIFTGELGEVSETLYTELKVRLRLALDL